MDYAKLHDELTPAEKAKHTRLYNRLNDRRAEAGSLLYNIYKEKQMKLEKIHEPAENEATAKYMEIQEECNKKIAEARQEMNIILEAIRKEKREALAPEWEAYENITTLALERFRKEWDEAQAEFFKSAGVI